MLKLTLYCLSVTVEDLNYNEDMKTNNLGTNYSVVLDSTLGARSCRALNFSCDIFTYPVMEIMFKGRK